MAFADWEEINLDEMLVFYGTNGVSEETNRET